MIGHLNKIAFVVNHLLELARALALTTPCHTTFPHKDPIARHFTTGPHHTISVSFSLSLPNTPAPTSQRMAGIGTIICPHEGI
jgi:hypothetical protein